MAKLRLIALLSAAATLVFPTVFADCECGYSVNSTSDENYAVFTDILESDFTLFDDFSENTDWVAQEWTIEPAKSKGPYGRKAELNNAVANPSKFDKGGWIGKNGRLAGTELYVRKIGKDKEHVSVAEIDSKRTDVLYGSFRAGIMITPISGTCAAFFWYLNDTQEIDMEFLSAQMNYTYAPVNLVIHSELTAKDGGDAKNTPTYKIVPLPFIPSDDIHEYRFDWQPESVTFFADGQQLAEIRDEQYVPEAPGKIILSHWSNGQKLWSGGPPEKDAIMTVNYVKAYFNSSDPARQKDHANRCDLGASNSICQIPEQKGQPKEKEVYFFSKDSAPNKVKNQTIFGVTDKSIGVMSMRLDKSTLLLMVTLGLLSLTL